MSHGIFLCNFVDNRIWVEDMNTSDVQAQKRRYGIVGNSEGLNHAVDIALQVAKTDLSVLITGESGVGKEIIPRIIHDNSLRKERRNTLP